MGDYLPFTLAKDGQPLDLSHHLSLEARERTPNPMKAIWKVAQSRPGAISLANGDPHYSLYPMRKMEFEVPSLDSSDPVHTWRRGEGATTSFSVSAVDEESSVAPLRRAMGYTTGAGLPETQRALAELTDLFHAPPNHQVTPTLGNFDAVTKCFRLLGERGDSFLADEFSFSALTNAAVAHGVNWVPVRIDNGGLVPDDLEKTLREWKEEQGRRPHVLYLTPSGQNPTGSTLSRERRLRIYEIAQRWDLIIIEDDPYFFLQYDLPEMDPARKNFSRHYASAFPPSFLSLDVDGRVLRVDSFSKILAPGMRLGWVTASPAFTERLVVLTDSSTMHPHGFGQLFVCEMLGPNGWGLDGFVRWVHSLRADYARRRDHFLRTFRELVPAEYAKTEVPQAGMFFWITVNLEQHPRYKSESDLQGTVLAKTNTKQLMEELFHKLLDDGVVMMPASIFAIEDKGKPTDLADRLNFFRATFAGTEEIVQDGLSIFAKGLKEFFACT